MANAVEDALRAELPYSHAFIRASVGPSRATLRGVVEWRYQKEQAELAVRAALPKIGDVRNLIRIRPTVGVDEVRQRMKDERRRLPGSVRAWAERRSA